MKVFRPDSDFIGRSVELAQMIRETTDCSAMHKPHITIVCGLGGVGKTQLVRRFVHDRQSKFEHIVWIESENRVSIEDTIKNVAKELSLPTTTVDDFNFVTEKVLNKLSTCPSLVVFDNVDDRELVRFVFTAATIGQHLHIVITSRLQDWSKSACTVIKLDVFSFDDADAFISKTLTYEDSDARSLIGTLQYFPLALRQATAYINYEREEVNPRFGVADYINIYNTQNQMLLNSNVFQKDLGNTYEKTTYTTWAISLDAFSRQGSNGKLAITILLFLAFFNPDRIRRDLFFKNIRGYNGNMLTERDVISAFKLLVDYSMVNRVDAEEYTIQIHRLVQTVVKLYIKDRNTEQMLRGCLTLINNMLQEVDFSACCDHAIAVFLLALKFKPIMNEFKRIPYMILSKLINWVKISTALEFGERVLEPFTNTFGAEDPDTLAIKFYVALSYLCRGKQSIALPMFQEVYEIHEKTFGVSHHKTIYLKALIHWDIGNHTAALEIFHEIYAKRTEMLGDYHDDTLTIKGSVAHMYRDLGRYFEALKMFEEVYEERKKSLGVKHSKTLLVKRLIASVHYDTGNYVQALELYQDILDNTTHVSENNNGYAERLQTTFHVALTNFKLGNYAEALQMLETVLLKQRNFFGEEYPELLSTEEHIAAVLYKLGEESDAMCMFDYVLDKYKRIFGEEHQRYLVYRCNTAAIYLEQGKYAQALPMLQDVLVKQTKIFDKTHRLIQNTRFLVAFASVERDRNIETFQTLQDIFDQIETAFGPSYPGRLETQYFMATANRDVGNLSQALTMYENILSTQKNIFGVHHTETLKTEAIITDLNEKLHARDGKMALVKENSNNMRKFVVFWMPMLLAVVVGAVSSHFWMFLCEK